MRFEHWRSGHQDNLCPTFPLTYLHPAEIQTIKRHAPKMKVRSDIETRCNDEADREIWRQARHSGDALLQFRTDKAKVSMDYM
jgi:hypothetical protein